MLVFFRVGLIHTGLFASAGRYGYSMVTKTCHAQVAMKRNTFQHCIPFLPTRSLKAKH